MDLWRPGDVPPAENSLGGEVREVIYRGETIHVLVGLPDGADADGRAAQRGTAQQAAALAAG